VVVVYLYLAEMNPDGLYLDSVPLRDLTADDVAELSPYLAASVAACPFYAPVSTPASNDAGLVAVVAVVAAGAAEQGVRRRAGVATKDETAAAGVAAPIDAE
jgi:hypothetical protein